MREILFRAKRIDNGEWVEGYLFDNDTQSDKHYFVGVIVANAYKGTAHDGDWIISGHCFCEIDPETLCQYTGLTDKKGRKVWENDIVEAWSEGVKAVGQVKKRVDGLYIIYPAYQNKVFWGLCPNDEGETSVTVIGNIFDNPELLKED